MNKIILLILVFGVILKLYLTSGGHFIFHMDIARDFLDVREMIEIGKLRLTGPTSAITGLYDGPAWYYLLSVPYLLTNGNPYSAVVMMIITWAIGGFFLLKLTSRFGTIPTIFAGLIWIGSDYLNLATSYSFHPHLITLLTPMFIYLLEQSLISPTLLNSTLLWLLAGAFFNFEMNFAIFTPVIILVSGFFVNRKVFKNKSFYTGSLAFIVCLLPQIAFDFKYHHQMFQAVWNYIQSQPQANFDPIARTTIITQDFYSVWLPSFMNSQALTNMSLFLITCSVLYHRRFLPALITYSLLLIAIPFIGFSLLPVSVNSWHLGGIISPLIILIACSISQLKKVPLGRLITLTILLATIILFVNKASDYVTAHNQPTPDQSTLINEIRAIDYVYQQAQGLDFKVYTYLPSVYDFPYQYLFWYYGRSEHGYLPTEYRYLPNKPSYVPSQSRFQKQSTQSDSHLIFLIKEPDDKQRRELWENSFRNLSLIKSTQIGPIIIETRQ